MASASAIWPPPMKPIRCSSLAPPPTAVAHPPETMEEEVETSISLFSAGRMGEVAAVRLAGGRGRGRGVLAIDPGVSVFATAVCGCVEDEGW